MFFKRVKVEGKSGIQFIVTYNPFDVIQTTKHYTTTDWIGKERVVSGKYQGVTSLNEGEHDVVEYYGECYYGVG